MAIINLSKILDLTRIYTTQAGQELKDFLDYSVQAYDVILRALRQGLNFEDNFYATVQTYSLYHDQDQIIFTNGRTPNHILFTRVVDTTILIGSHGWYINDSGETVVHIKYDGGVANTAYDTTLIICY